MSIAECRLPNWGWAFGIVLAFALGAGPASLPTSQPIERNQLDAMVRRELGPHYKPADVEKYHTALQLIERYFAAPADRPAIVRSLESLQLDANTIGRLTRIRIDWPQLAPGVYYINERIGPHTVRYFLGVPKNYDRTTAWPLVIKLPTADAFVAQPKPDPVQVADIYAKWMIDELSRHPDAILLMPLLNLDEAWGPSYVGMNSVIQPLLHAAGRANVDPARVYMAGHAMSGHAVWNLALHYTTYFASFNVLAGGASGDWQRLRLMNLGNVLPVVWHDADDTVLKVDSARQLVKVLRGLKCDVDYTETRRIGHVPTDSVAEQCYQKMRSRARQLYPKQVSVQSNRPDTMFNRNDWVQVYQPLQTGDESKMFFARGTGHMVVYGAAFTLQAAIANNRITVTSKNVQSMRLYVNDQMADLSRPISVSVNGKVRFEQIVQPGIEEMLKDQLFMGRGWRYYTAIIDIDFGAASTTQP